MGTARGLLNGDNWGAKQPLALRTYWTKPGKQHGSPDEPPRGPIAHPAYEVHDGDKTRQFWHGSHHDLYNCCSHAKLSRRLFWTLVATDSLLAFIFGNHPPTGSDAAGNGMAQGFAFLLMLAVFVVLALVAAIFAFVLQVAVRYVLAGLALALGLSFALALTQ